jgi:methylated-DNA-[protein]-cysteine S-methyltransferase
MSILRHKNNEKVYDLSFVEEMMLCSYYIGRMDVGWLGVLMSTEGVRRVCLPQKTQTEASKILFSQAPAAGCLRLKPDTERCYAVYEQLVAYFDGIAREFDCELDTSAFPEFHRKVWKYVRRIPHGETRSYSWVAKKLGKPEAARAVGAALARNPLPILVPCHRVILAGGGLGGFSGGVEWKERLLQLEKALRE